MLRHHSARSLRRTFHLEHLEGRNLPATALFVSNLYVDLLQRQPGTTSQAEINSWLNTGLTEGQLVHAFQNSTEARVKGINEVANLYFGRNATGDELDDALDNADGKGQDAENLLISVGSSSDYRNLTDPSVAGGKDENYIRRLYRDLLGRANPNSIPAGDVNTWLDVLHDHGADDVVQGFIYSQEFSGQLVDRFYQQILDRPADASGRANLVGQLSLQPGEHDRLTIEGLITALATSPEYLAKQSAVL